MTSKTLHGDLPSLGFLATQAIMGKGKASKTLSSIAKVLSSDCAAKQLSACWSLMMACRALTVTGHYFWPPLVAILLTVSHKAVLPRGHVQICCVAHQRAHDSSCE